MTVTPNSAMAAVVVGEALDVVFAEVRAVLHLDEHERTRTPVRDAVCGAHRDVDRLSGSDDLFDIVEGHDGVALDDEPVLGSLAVPLVAQPVSGIDGHALDLVRVVV